MRSNGRVVSECAFPQLLGKKLFELSVYEKLLSYVMAVDAVTGCWLGKGNGPNGYTYMSALRALSKDGSRHARVYAHRESYELFLGKIPDTLVIDHLCRNKACFNPTHLEAVTQEVNLLRARAYERDYASCPNGHPRNAKNTRRKGNKWTCRPCYAALARAWRAKQKEKREQDGFLEPSEGY